MEADRQKMFTELDLLDARLEDLLSELEGISLEILARRKEPEQWSPIEVCQHLYLSEKLSLAYVQKKLSFDPVLRKAGLLSWIRSLVLNWYLQTKLKFKAPKSTTKFRMEGLTVDLIAIDWNGLRATLRQIITEMDSSHLDKAIYRHPIVGRLSILQMLRFFRSHFDHHYLQIIERL
ncbi:MAG: DinB family protein [Saprospiraceae bacterium]|nr:DinB family protein [Saprospiraceae bacterium]